MSDPDQVNNADVNADIDTDLPENSAPMMRFLKLKAQSCLPGQYVMGCQPMEGIIEPLQVELLGLAMAPDSTHEEHLPNSKPWNQSVLDMTRSQDNLKRSEGTQFGYVTGQSSPELEDAIRREVLRSRLMRYMSSRDVNGRLLSPEHANLSDMEMSLDQVRSEGLRSGIWTWKWNINMKQLTVCRCIMVEICMIRRTRKSSILLKRRVLLMQKIIILAGWCGASARLAGCYRTGGSSG